MLFITVVVAIIIDFEEDFNAIIIEVKKFIITITTTIIIIEEIKGAVCCWNLSMIIVTTRLDY